MVRKKKLKEFSPFVSHPGSKIKSSKILTKKKAPMCLDISSSSSSDDSSSDKLLKGEKNSIFMILNRQKKLDTGIFELFLEKMWKTIEDGRRKEYTCLDCLWFHMYEKKGSDKEKIMGWIKEKEVFSRKYVFVPIICWNHWSLLILCDLDETPNLNGTPESKEPFIVLLDSQKELTSQRLEPCIRNFVSDIYKFVVGTDEAEFCANMPFIVPKVMKQKDDKECGIFVLYFMKLFLHFVPTNFAHSETAMYFNDNIWHNHDKLEEFCQEIYSLCGDKTAARPLVTKVYRRRQGTQPLVRLS